MIIGDWTKWQKKEKMHKVTPSGGTPYFSILLALNAGTHRYKYIVDDIWRENPNTPTEYNNFGTLNNIVEVRR